MVSEAVEPEQVPESRAGIPLRNWCQLSGRRFQFREMEEMIVIQPRLTVREGGGGCIHTECPAMPTASPQGGLPSCWRIREQEFTPNPKGILRSQLWASSS